MPRLEPLAAVRGIDVQGGDRDAFRDVTGRTKRGSVFQHIDPGSGFSVGGEVALLDHSPLLDDVIEAVLHHQVLSIEYTRFNGKVEHLRVEPLSIVVHDHQLYVVGRDRRGRPAPYRFSRFRSVDVLADTFEYPSRTSTTPRRCSAIVRHLPRVPVHDIELKLHKQWTTYAQSHRWHDSQKVEVAATTSSCGCTCGCCPELEAWILGFGEQAEGSPRRRSAPRLAGAPLPSAESTQDRREAAMGHQSARRIDGCRSGRGKV